MKNKIHKGLLFEPIIPEKDYVFGSYTKLTGPALEPSGQWDKYLSPEEVQHNDSFDTMSCATFATVECVQMMERRLFLKSVNYSDRFTSKDSGTTEQGNTPQRVCESVRKTGLVEESLWPWTNVKTFEAFMASIPKKLYLIASEWLTEYKYGHEYVATTPDFLKQALKYSPLSVSVYAWVLGSDGLYYKPEGAQDTHLTVMYGYEDEKYWKIYDTYEPFYKKVKWNTPFQVAKRHQLTVQVKNTAWEGAMDFIKQMFQALFTTKYSEIDPIPEPPKPMEIPAKTNSTILLDTAISCLGKDMGKTQDELACAESVNAICNLAFGEEIGGGTSTLKMYEALKKSPLWEKTNVFEAGSLIISPTGYGTGLPNGHVGIMLNGNDIMSNDSKTGLWSKNFTIQSWVDRYRTLGKYPILVFKRK